MLLKSPAVLLFCLVIAGCTSGNKDVASPQKALSDYVSRSFAVKSVEDKARLLELTSGKAKESLEALNNDNFKTYFLDEKREFLGLKIKDERKIGDDEYSITYEISYINKSQNSQDRVTNKKHALFKLLNGKWSISEVKNIKTFIEHEGELTF